MPDTTIPNTIRQQITVGVLMSLGATDLMADRGHTTAPEPYDALTFRARILPSKTARPRIMRVKVTLDPSDTYSIKVTYPKRGNAFEEVTHYEASDVYCDQLARTLLDLDNVL
jgi:hypothetical protein